MNSYLLEKNDKRGKILYQMLINNKDINEDYFSKNDKNSVNIEDYFKTNREYTSRLSENIKRELVLKLKNHKLKIFDYFNLSELYFNKYFYDLVYEDSIEHLLKKYFD